VRVPTRDIRYFDPSQLGALRELRRDDRVPRLATPGARKTVYQLFAEAYRDVQRGDRLDDSRSGFDWMPMPDEASLTRRLSELLLEARWTRVLQTHRLCELH
jgi:hypothetical protein